MVCFLTIFIVKVKPFCYEIENLNFQKCQYDDFSGAAVSGV
jgi:hypothetical protein